jgi:undecaprenyl-diphosphatase
VLGVAFHRIIKEVLLNPTVVCVSLLLGGIAILVIERLRPPARQSSVDAFRWPLALQIGMCQVLAMIPGVSRAGATIMGAMLLGVERKAATEFSFFLAIPTMLGATVYDSYKNAASFAGSNLLVIAIGFVVAFLVAIVVVRWLIGFVSTNDFTPFGWYRIAVGLLGGAWLLLK